MDAAGEPNFDVVADTCCTTRVSLSPAAANSVAADSVASSSAAAETVTGFWADSAAAVGRSRLPVDDGTGVVPSRRIEDGETRVMLLGRTVVLSGVVDGAVPGEASSWVAIAGPSLEMLGFSIAFSAAPESTLLLAEAGPAEPSAPVSCA